VKAAKIAALQCLEWLSRVALRDQCPPFAFSGMPTCSGEGAFEGRPLRVGSSWYLFSHAAQKASVNRAAKIVFITVGVELTLLARRYGARFGL
jgi:hypothetical protein